MNNAVETVADNAKWLMRIVSRRRWLVLGVAAVAGVACAVGLTQVPNRYEAVARVYVDTDTVLKPLMAGLTFQPDIDQQVRMLARTLVSRANVERLVDMPELHFQVPNASAREDLIANLIDQIKITPTSSGNLFELSYRGSDPDRAKRLVDATVNLFMYAGTGAKKRDSEDAGRFIESQIQVYESKLIESENRLKEFKARHFGMTGVSNQDYFSHVSTLSSEVDKLRIDLRAAEQARDAYRHELASENPQLPMDLASKYVAAASPDETRLDALKKRLEDLLNSYTEAHPEVINTRRMIAKLEADQRRQAEALGGSPLAKAATSPVYQKLRISLADTEAMVASLRSQLTAKQSQLDQVRALAGRIPQAEAELSQLNRDYDVLRKNYDLMVARREAASLGVKLDESSQLTEFRVIEPARVPRSPVFPSRAHLAVIAVFVSLALGAASALVADLMHPTFEGAADLRLYSKRPVLATIPSLAIAEGRRQSRVSLLRVGAPWLLVPLIQSMWMVWGALNSTVGVFQS